MAGSTSTAAATRPKPRSGRKAGSTRVEVAGDGLIVDERLTSSEAADEFLLMGLRLAEGIDPERFTALSGRTLDPKRISILRDEGAVETTREGRLRVTQ